jgi:hypothetical protein
VCNIPHCTCNGFKYMFEISSKSNGVLRPRARSPTDIFPLVTEICILSSSSGVVNMHYVLMLDTANR